MGSEGFTPDDEPYETQVALDTGIRDQRLVVPGWFASHADSGTPGPHVHLSTNDKRNPVLQTSQIPELVEALQVVGGHIDRMWEEQGETWFTGDEPDHYLVSGQRRSGCKPTRTVAPDHAGRPCRDAHPGCLNFVGPDTGPLDWPSRCQG